MKKVIKVLLFIVFLPFILYAILLFYSGVLGDKLAKWVKYLCE